MTPAPRSADHVHAALSRQIVSGTLPPGTPLAEAALASEFGVSRTPVREALHRLASEGLIERGPRRAFVIRRMSREALGDLFEAMGELEALCADLAARRMTAVERAALRAILDEADLSDISYARINARFHDALRLGCQNEVLAALLEDLNRRSMPWRSAQFDIRRSRIDSSRAEHRAILAAVEAQDGPRAAELMRGHVAGSLAIILDLIEAPAPLPPEAQSVDERRV
ncbi:GntR family transcriptional regulator [Paracoccus sp. (in: a-proteobacteria)]|uniref:GntR family transcriptional regulator n=1 Tax=Paracoccus sp. TaxID=267 RepID=UPI00396CA415